MTKQFSLVNKQSVPVFIETPTVKRIHDMLTYCHQEDDIGIIVGKPGVGKTTALKQYALLKNSKSFSVLYCSLSPALNSMSAVLNHLVSQLGGGNSRQISELHEKMLYFVNSFSMPLIIIDEAQILSDNIIDELRCIYDAKNFPLIFCGNAKFKSRFNNAKAASFTQFTSRVGIRLDIDEPCPKDIEAVCEAFSIDKSPATLKYITQLAKTSGGLRVISKLADQAKKLTEDEKVTNTEFREVAKLMGHHND